MYDGNVVKCDCGNDYRKVERKVIMNNQEKEIATISPRNISINLSDADVDRLCNKVGSAGLTVPELLQNFIGDLVNGTYSNGSDERMYANEWFDRCWFGMFPDKTFLRYLINNWKLDDVLDLWDDITTAQEELEYANTHKNEMSDDEIAEWKEDLASSQSELNDIFIEFQSWTNEKDIGTLEEEMQKITKWKSEVEDFKSAK